MAMEKGLKLTSKRMGGRIVACFLFSFYLFSSTTGVLKEEKIDIKPSGQLTDESLKLVSFI